MIVFNGDTKRIIITAPTSNVNIKTDIYSGWKNWVLLNDNSKYPQALRTIGGDPIGGGLKAGDMYFLMNGWQIECHTIIKANGILYHDDGVDPFVVMPSGGVTSTVSSLAYSYESGGSSSGLTLGQIENSTILAKELSVQKAIKHAKNAEVISASIGT